MWYVHTVEYPSAISKDEILPQHGICSSMNGPGEYYAKQNKPDRKSQQPSDFTHMWVIKLQVTNKKNNKNNKNS